MLELAAVLAGGLAMGLTLPRPGLCPLAWVALVPLLRALLPRERVYDPSRGTGRLTVRKGVQPSAQYLPLIAAGMRPVPRESGRTVSSSRAGILGAAFGLGFHGLVFFWIYSTCRFAHIPFPSAPWILQVATSAAAWLALASLMSLSWVLFALAAARLGRRLPRPALPWACAALWAGLEFLFSRYSPGLGLVMLAYSQWRFPSWIQGVSLAGPHVLGFLVVLWNASLAVWISDRSPTSPRSLSPEGGEGGARMARPLRNVGAAAALLLAWRSYGFWALRFAPPLGSGGVYAAAARRPAPGEAAPHRIAILQPDVDQYAKWDERYVGRVRGVLNDLLGRAREDKAELVVWPESSVPGWFDEPDNFYWIKEWAVGGGAYQLVGALTRENEAHDNFATGAAWSAERRHNSAVLVAPSGALAGVYHKRRLVPFGEFVPIRFLGRFIGLLEQMGDLDPGAMRQPPLQTPVGLAGATVCFEALFPSLNRTAAEHSRVLINLTNDGWYENTWGPYQHFQANAFRAVENRIYVVRAANTGISGVFDPWGRVTASLPLETRGVLPAELPARDPFPRRSPYTRHGDWFGWACVAASCLLLVATALNRLRDE